MPSSVFQKSLEKSAPLRLSFIVSSHCFAEIGGNSLKSFSLAITFKISFCKLK
ncbi:MAG: hypothetical protein BWX61_01437 [Bacteroidetes bacterium ADurb.Bin035]|nr:MAG: hypothetical protein BWX61_01437 [Bacteroidetes bacterium ADurb.Bin035]